MSPEERTEIVRSVANLWTFQTSFMVQIMLALQAERVLSGAAIETVLQRLDRDADLLEGETDQQMASNAVATVRALVHAWRDEKGRKPE